MQPLFGNTAIWSKEATEEIFSVAHKADRIVLIVGGLVLLCVGAGLVAHDAVTHAVVFFVLGLVLFLLGAMAPAIYLARQTHKYRALFGEDMRLLIQFYDDGFTVNQISAQGVPDHMGYGHIVRWVETKNFFFLYTDKGNCYALAKAGFAVGDVEGFPTFLRHKAPNVR
ncbi:YcxB family protein [Ruthenibacterium sp. CLA-JM-H11]|uniref:YcxB family protein n=1 Tax=Ruthenibacterium intestinale TaxID=3133163 RepID=A0ABV1GBZ4_9FIRM